jgi:hypothetical protein
LREGGFLGPQTSAAVAPPDARDAALRQAREALDVLYNEANNFGVSDVYFSEACMGHKGLGLAAAAIAAIDEALK